LAKQGQNPDGLSAASYEKVLETFQKEEKAKAGKNIYAKYSEFQVNKVPASRSQLKEFPNLYKLFVEDSDYQNKVALNGE